MIDSRSPSAVAKRHLFSRPNKVNRVYPDDNIGTTTVSASPAPPKLGPTPQQSRLLHGSFESEESAYQSGGSSPACEATAAEAAATRGGSTVDLDGGGATAAARAPAMDSSQQKRDSSAVASAATPSADAQQQPQKRSLTSQKPPVANPRRFEVSSVGLSRKGSSLDLLGRVGGDGASSSTGADGATGSRRQSRRYSVSGGPMLQEVTLATAGLDQSGDDFKERLKRLFGARPSIGGGAGGVGGTSGAAVAGSSGGGSGGPGGPSGGSGGSGQVESSSSDLQRSSQSRSRRTSLAARLFSRLPFGRRDDVDASDAEAAGGTVSDEATRYCRLCGEANCELHGSLSEMGWARRQLAVLGCYRTREDHERSMLLENHTATRFVTAAAAVIFLAIVIALVVLCVIAAQKSRSVTSESATATTTVPYSNTT
ncbi:hypothetical protein BOX15_Mlig019692g1 [Macrostomum lignano]|uniref:Uncharacterized protein n=1 Tax=Macrostomum lignano TaxID=282301 RepID=A0A267H2A5_9PLAT|nr:hypothetical protein BOX15_Mlig019692g1 [Macrostomum lignano]